MYDGLYFIKSTSFCYLCDSKRSFAEKKNIDAFDGIGAYNRMKNEKKKIVDEISILFDQAVDDILKSENPGSRSYFAVFEYQALLCALKNVCATIPDSIANTDSEFPMHIMK